MNRLLLLAVALLCGSTAQAQDFQLRPGPTTPLGEQRIAIVLVNFSDRPEQPFTHAQAAGVLSSLNVMEAWTFGALRFTGDVFGYVTIGPATCNVGTISTQADAALSAQGVDLSPYPLPRVYVHPGINCGWGGWGANGRLFLNGTLDAYIVVHEMGHAFGLQHSRAKSCQEPTCVNIEYGPFDTMGSGTGPFNGFQQDLLGWLSSSATPQTIRPVTTSGPYALEPLDLWPAGGPKVLAIRHADGAGDFQYWTYLEYRPPFGVLAWSIEWAGPSLPYAYAANLTDLAPTTAVDQWTLGLGQSATLRGSAVTLLSHDQTGALVDVQLPPTLSAPTNHLR